MIEDKHRLEIAGTARVAALRHTLLALAVVAIVYVVTLAAIERHGVWTVDNGNKIIQLDGIVAGGYEDYSIRWPGAALDPALGLNPIPWPFGVVQDGWLYSIFSPVFAVVSSVFEVAFGHDGLYVLPLAASILMLTGLARLTALLGGDGNARAYAVVLAGLCTPIWFYSVTFWEHAIAVCLGIWSVYWCLGYIRSGSFGSLVKAALASSAAVYFRDEFPLFALVLLALTAHSCSGRKIKTAVVFGATFLAVLVPLWIFQWSAIGRPFGFHVATHVLSTTGIAGHLLARPRVFFYMFSAACDRVGTSVVVTLPFVAAFLLNPRLPEKWFRRVPFVYGGIALGVSFYIYTRFIRSGLSLDWVGYTNSLFPTAPILILALVRYRDGGNAPAESGPGRLCGQGAAAYRQVMTGFIWKLALAYALLYALVAPEMGAWGRHWGNRLLLVVYPLLASLAALNIVAWRRRAGRAWLIVPVLLVILVSLGAQVLSVAILDRKRTFTHEMNRRLEARSERIVVTDEWWLGQELYRVFQERMIFLVQTEEAYLELLSLVSAHGYRRILLVTSNPDIWPTATGVETVSDMGMGLGALRLIPIGLPVPDSPS